MGTGSEVCGRPCEGHLPTLPCCFLPWLILLFQLAHGDCMLCHPFCGDTGVRGPASQVLSSVIDLGWGFLPCWEKQSVEVLQSAAALRHQRGTGAV